MERNALAWNHAPLLGCISSTFVLYTPVHYAVSSYDIRSSCDDFSSAEPHRGSARARAHSGDESGSASECAKITSSLIMTDVTSVLQKLVAWKVVLEEKLSIEWAIRGN